MAKNEEVQDSYILLLISYKDNTLRLLLERD